MPTLQNEAAVKFSKVAGVDHERIKILNARPVETSDMHDAFGVGAAAAHRAAVGSLQCRRVRASWSYYKIT